MSTESIFPKGLLFNEPYYGDATPLGYVESPEVAKLILSFEDDKNLCGFFIKNVFKDLPKKPNDNKKDEINEDYRNLIDFIRTSQIIPHCTPNKPSESTFKFFKRLSDIADTLFQEKIDRRFANICEKAEKIGIIRPELYIDSVKHNGKTIQRINLHDEKDELFVFDTCLFTFYKISESLFELWIKPENLGMFLEVWVYHMLKSFFDLKDLTIYHRVNIYPKMKEMETIQDLANARPDFNITELDVAMFKNKKPICGVECKQKAEFSDLLKFYGTLKLLNIPEGIFVCVNQFAGHENYRKFENIHIFTNVTEYDMFLSKMKGVSTDIYSRN